MAELWDTYTLQVGELTLTFDQNLWGKVSAVRAIALDGGTYPLFNQEATMRLRQLLEATSLYGELGVTLGDPLLEAVVVEARAVVNTVFPPNGEEGG